MAQLTEDLLTCQICMFEYNQDKLIPRLLECHHTFCELCLTSILRAGSIACPTCRIQSRVSSCKELQTNFYVQQFQAFISSSNTCKKHGFQRLSFYCYTCKAEVCCDCTVLEHSSAKGHNITEIANVIEKTMKEIEALQKDMKDKFQKHRDILSTVENALLNGDLLKTQMEPAITLKINSIIDTLNKRWSQLLENPFSNLRLTEELMPIKEELSGHLRVIDKHIENASNCQNKRLHELLALEEKSKRMMSDNLPFEQLIHSSPNVQKLLEQFQSPDLEIYKNTNTGLAKSSCINTLDAIGILVKSLTCTSELYNDPVVKILQLFKDQVTDVEEIATPSLSCPLCVTASPLKPTAASWNLCKRHLVQYELHKISVIKQDLKDSFHPKDGNVPSTSACKGDSAANFSANCLPTSVFDQTKSSTLSSQNQINLIKQDLKDSYNADQNNPSKWKWNVQFYPPLITDNPINSQVGASTSQQGQEYSQQSYSTAAVETATPPNAEPNSTRQKKSTSPGYRPASSTRWTGEASTPLSTADMQNYGACSSINVPNNEGAMTICQADASNKNGVKRNFSTDESCSTKRKK